MSSINNHESRPTLDTGIFTSRFLKQGKSSPLSSQKRPSEKSTEWSRSRSSYKKGLKFRKKEKLDNFRLGKQGKSSKQSSKKRPSEESSLKNCKRILYKKGLNFQKKEEKLSNENKKLEFNNREREKLEKGMERTIENEKRIKSGQATLSFEYYVSLAMMIARKKFRDKLTYLREKHNYDVVSKNLPQLMTKMIFADDKNLILNTEKGFCNLSNFLSFYIRKKIKNENELERFIRQLAYGMLNIIKSFNLNGILHGDIKPSNIILNYNPIVGEDNLILKMIDLGFSINFDYAQTKDSDFMESKGSTKCYTNNTLIDSNTKGAILAAELWCLGNIILELIEIFTQTNNLKCGNIHDYTKNFRNKIDHEKFSTTIRLLDALFSEDVLSKIDELINFLIEDLKKKNNINYENLYNKDHGYLIDIEGLSEFIDKIYELNPILQNLNESNIEEAYKKAFLYTKMKPNSENIKKQGKMIFLKCLKMGRISKEYISKCLFHLGNSFHQTLRNYQFCKQILKNYSSISQIFSMDFKTQTTKSIYKEFVEKIEKNKIIDLLKNLALLALNIQNKISSENSPIKARYFDLVSLSFEYDGKYEEAFSYQKIHQGIWCSTNLPFPGDIDYSDGQLLKYAIFSKLNEDDCNFIKRLINKMDLKEKNENAWSKHYKVYRSLFQLKNGNKKEKKNAYITAKLLFKELITSIENRKFPNHPDLYDLVELLDGIFCYESTLKNFDQPSITSEVVEKRLFSLLTFEKDDEDFLKGCKEAYENFKDKVRGV